MTSNNFSCAEFCDRIKYEFEVLQSVHTVSKMDSEKIQAEKRDLKIQSKKVYFHQN